MVNALTPNAASSVLRYVEGPSHEDIAERAFNIFQQRGGAAGQDLDDWLQAERELLLERSRHAGLYLIEEEPIQPQAEPVHS